MISRATPDPIVAGQLSTLGPAEPAARRVDPARQASRSGWIAGAAGACIAVGVGIAAGLAATASALRHGDEVGAVGVGPWRLRPGEGTASINPYLRAAYARSGTVPMSAGQGVALTAARDSAGRRLDAACTYQVSGPVPRARYWTLSASSPSGRSPGSNPLRTAFTSDAVLRDEAGAFNIVLSARPQPGNWLPLPGSGSFALALRLYDSLVPGLGGRELRSSAVPTITALRCN